MAPHLTSLAASPSRPSSLVSTSTPHPDEAATPTDLLLATPPAVLKLLALAAPLITGLTTLVQLLTWTHPSFFASLLILLGWWAICLFGTYIALYGLNAAFFVYIVLHYLTSASSRAHRRVQRNPTLTPASYANLISSAQILTTHVHALRATLLQPVSAQLSLSPVVAGQPAPAYRTARFLLTSYPFYLALTYIVPLRFIFLALGSTAILWNAPFFRTLRALMRKSAFVRWVGRILVAILNGGAGLGAEFRRTRSGVGVPGLLGRKSGTVASPELKSVKKLETEGSHEDVQVLFTCMENQRWWVGLDWTHALLPGERASWTDPALNPTSPPSSFSLPPPSVSYISSPTKSDPHARFKRTTEWKWLDPEWKVMLSTAPNVPEPASPTIPVAEDASKPLPSPTHQPSEDFFANWQVDEEGWQYGDNMFEKMGAKGGLGRYTRRRAWIRRAGLVEKEEIVAGDSKTKEKTAITNGSTAKVSTTVRSSSRDSKDRKRVDGASVPSNPLGDGADLRRRKSSSSSRKPVSPTR